jgi:hypothetical protein
MTMSVVTSVSAVGSKKVPPSADRLVNRGRRRSPEYGWRRAGRAGFCGIRGDRLDRHLDVGIRIRLQVPGSRRNRRTVQSLPGSRISVPRSKLSARTKVPAELPADLEDRPANPSF